MIRVKYDDQKISDQEIITLSNAIIKIVQDTTEIPEVFVYGDSPRIKIGVAPIEIFIEMSASKINDKDLLFENIKEKLLSWKQENKFTYPINITLIPMDWKFDVNI